MIFINNFAQRALFALKRVFETRFNSSGLNRKNHSLSVLMDFSPNLPFLLFLLRFLRSLSDSSEESSLSAFPVVTFTFTGFSRHLAFWIYCAARTHISWSHSAHLSGQNGALIKTWHVEQVVCKNTEAAPDAWSSSLILVTKDTSSFRRKISSNAFIALSDNAYFMRTSSTPSVISPWSAKTRVTVPTFCYVKLTVAVRIQWFAVGFRFKYNVAFLYVISDMLSRVFFAIRGDEVFPTMPTWYAINRMAYVLMNLTNAAILSWHYKNRKFADWNWCYLSSHVLLLFLMQLVWLESRSISWLK